MPPDFLHFTDLRASESGDFTKNHPDDRPQAPGALIAP